MENKERQLISTVQNHRESIDTDELWGAISPHIPQKEEGKRRPLIWMFFVGISILAISAFLWKNDEGKDMISDAKVKSAMSILDDEKVSTNATEKSSNRHGQIISNTAGKSTKSREENTSKSAPSYTNEVTKINQKNIINNRSIPLAKNTRNNKISNENSSLIYSANIVELSSDENLDFPKNKTAGFLQDEIVNSHKNRDDFSIKTERNSIQEFDILPTFSAEVIKADKELITIDSKAVFETPLQIQNSPKFSLVFQSGVGFSSVGLSAKEPEFEYQSANISQAISPAFVSHLDVLIGCKLGRYVFLSSGVTYLKSYDKVSFQSNYTYSNSSTEVVSIIHYQDGSSVTETGEVVNENSRESTITGYNTRSQFSVPIKARFYAYNNQNIQFFIEPMMSYSFSQKQSGYINFDSNESAYSLAQDVDNKYRKYGSINTGISLGAEWNLTENNALLFNTTYHKGGNLFNTNVPLNQSYKSLRFSVGYQTSF